MSEVKTCPRCAEDVKEAAAVCRYCGHEFEDQAAGQAPAAGPGTQAPSISVLKLALGVALGLGIAAGAFALFKGGEAAATKSPQEQRQSDRLVTSQVSLAFSVGIDCLMDNREGQACEEAIAKEKVPLGSGRGEVEFANYQPQSFESEKGKVTFIGHSKSGTDFKLTYDGRGNSRRCSAPGVGSCPADGDWGGLE